MSEFKAIETQEELDNIIKDRLDRNTKKITAEVTKQFEGFISPDDAAKSTKALEDKITALTAQLADKDTSACGTRQRRLLRAVRIWCTTQ